MGLYGGNHIVERFQAGLAFRVAARGALNLVIN